LLFDKVTDKNKLAHFYGPQCKMHLIKLLSGRIAVYVRRCGLLLGLLTE